MPARSVCLVALSLSEAGPGRFGRQVSVIDIYHTIPYHTIPGARYGYPWAREFEPADYPEAGYNTPAVHIVSHKAYSSPRDSDQPCRLGLKTIRAV